MVLLHFARAVPFLLTACQLSWANYSAPATVPYIPDYGGVLTGEKDPTGEAKYVVGHRYFLNDADWEVSTLAGVYDVTLKQISARLYSVAKVEKYGYTDGATERSRFWNPTGIAFFEANQTIYLTDKNNHRIRMIDPVTGVTRTLAGSGVAGFKDSSDRMLAQFNYPSGVAVDGGGNVYVADMHNHRIRCVTANGPVVTIAGGVAGFANLPGAAAMFNYPTGVTAAADGTLFVADMNNHRIRKIFLDDKGNPLAMNRLVVTLAGSIAGWKDAFGSYAKFHSPTGLTLHLATGDIYVADCSNQRIRKVDKYGTTTTIAGSSVGDADGANSMMARFNFPFGITVSQVSKPNPEEGKPDLPPSVYFTDAFSNRIRALHRHYYDPKLLPVAGEVRPEYNCTTVAGSVPGYLDGWGNMSRTFLPAGIAIAKSGNIYFADSSNNVVRKIERGASMGGRPMCKYQSGTCKVKRQCRDLSGALCAYRPGPCLVDDTCLCDVLFHNATCVEKKFVSGASKGIQAAWIQMSLFAVAALAFAGGYPGPRGARP